MKQVIGFILSLFLSGGVFAAQSDRAAEEVARIKAAPSFKAWMKAEESREGSLRNGANARPGPKDLCQAMSSVGLGCSYAERGYLVSYLFGHGMDIVPCEGGSNPYTRSQCGKMGNDPRYDGLYNYIGQPGQNKTLKESIVKNRKLFRNGDLTAANAKKWQK